MIPPESGLESVLSESQARGFLGPGALRPHVDRALAVLPLLPQGAVKVLDLGSGGGLPGLPLAVASPARRWWLLDGSTTRADFLRDAVVTLGIADRVEVIAERAEVAGRTILRGGFDAVVARSFGPPAVTAECAAPFLRPGGILVVSEPPGGDPGRWPADGLSILGMKAAQAVTEPYAFQTIEQVSPCPARYPRRTGVPAKKPLF